MTSDVLRLIITWVFAIIGIIFSIKDILKIKSNKFDPKKLILTLFLIILSISFTIDFVKIY